MSNIGALSFLKEYNNLLKEKRSLSIGAMVVLGLIAGLFGTLIIAIINRVIHIDPQNKTFLPNLFLGFISVLGVHFIVQTFYQLSLIRLSHRMIWRLRKLTLDNVRQADYLKLLAFGTNRVHSILTRDAFDMSTFSQMTSSVIVSLVTLLSGLGYLLWISPIGCLVTIFLSLCIIGVQLFTRRKIEDKINIARKKEEDYNKYFLFVLEGVKELKLDQKKSDDMFNNYLSKTGDEAQKMWADITIKFYTNGAIGQLLFYMVVAIFLFVLPYFHISLLPDSFEYILILMYLMGPVNMLVNAVPSFTYARRALSRFSELSRLKEAREVADREHPIHAGPGELSFHDLSFQYETEGDGNRFSIGPLNFSLAKGEIAFLTGANGSGKSTFLRLLTGLYSPQSGCIKIDGRKISNIQTDAYRSLFSVVYTDSYLFDTLIGFGENQDRKINQILDDLALGEKVTCKDHVFSTIDLSYGQRKRLSLAVSMLDDKPIYVFDELAANQDTGFKQYFYYTILNDLKMKGKIVFVVTHDEKYFHLADKHFKMEDGCIVSQEKVGIQ